VPDVINAAGALAGMKTDALHRVLRARTSGAGRFSSI
jgi:hypothetical protein